jgi:hypothetical protein
VTEQRLLSVLTPEQAVQFRAHLATIAAAALGAAADCDD